MESVGWFGLYVHRHLDNNHDQQKKKIAYVCEVLRTPYIIGRTRELRDKTDMIRDQTTSVVSSINTGARFVFSGERIRADNHFERVLSIHPSL